MALVHMPVSTQIQLLAKHPLFLKAHNYYYNLNHGSR